MLSKLLAPIECDVLETSLQPVISPMQFTIPSILIITVAAALILAFDRQGFIFGPVLFFSVAVGLTLVTVGVFARLRLLLASAFVPKLYRMKLLWLARPIFGRTYTAWSLHNYGVKLFEAGDIEHAAKLFEQVVRFSKSGVEYLLWLAVANYQLGRYDVVIESVSTAIELGDTSWAAYAYRGFSRYATGDFTGALQDFQKVDGSTNEHSSLIWHRAHVHEMHGQWAEAAKDYQRSFQLDGNNLAAGIAFARLQACCPDKTIRNGDKAVENATSMCVRTDWKDWVAISVLASAYAEKGDFSTAVQYADRARELAPESSQQERAERVEQYRSGIPFRLVASPVCTAEPMYYQ